jgi:hypothetical protein
VSHYHLRPLVEEIGGQEGEHVHEQLGGADDDEQYNEQEATQELSRKPPRAALSRLPRKLTKYLRSEGCATRASRRARNARDMT